MKDYRLSEIVTHCKEMQDEYGKQACNICNQKFSDLCLCCINRLRGIPFLWGKNYIEPRDMVELPYKHEIHFDGAKVPYWQVVYRCNDGVIEEKIFKDEKEATSFYNSCKGENKDDCK